MMLWLEEIVTMRLLVIRYLDRMRSINAESGLVKARLVVIADG
jgi:hypothetical protein